MQFVLVFKVKVVHWVNAYESSGAGPPRLSRPGFILAYVVCVKKMKKVENLCIKIILTGRPTHFKWQHGGSITHSTLLHMHSKLVVLGE